MTSSDIASAAILIESAVKRLLMSGMLETSPLIKTLLEKLAELEDMRVELAGYELDEQIERLEKAKASIQKGAGASPYPPSQSLNPAPAPSCVDSERSEDWEAL